MDCLATDDNPPGTSDFGSHGLGDTSFAGALVEVIHAASDLSVLAPGAK